MDKSSKTRIIKGLIYGAIFGIIVGLGWNFVNYGGLGFLNQTIVHLILFILFFALMYPTAPFQWLFYGLFHIQPSYFQVIIAWAIIGAVLGYFLKSKKAFHIALLISIPIFIILFFVAYYLLMHTS